MGIARPRRIREASRRASGNPRTIHYELMKVISELYPLEGEEADKEMARVTAPVKANAKRLGLTEKRLTALLDAK